MTGFLRDASPALEAALAANAIRYSADLYSIALVDGTTVLNWTNFDRDLTHAGTTYSAQKAFLSRSSWKVTNTMEVTSLTLKAASLNAGFNGGSSLQAQIHDGLLDGAVISMQKAPMGLDANPDTLGTIALFVGKVGAIDLDGLTATIAAKSKLNDLDQFAPRNLYQVSCNHAFCDTGCALSRAGFTATYSVGTGPTSTFIPWISAPSIAARYQNGTLAFTWGASSGSRRTIVKADTTGLTLAYPLPFVPAPGDGFTAFQGCDKTYNSGSPQSCTAYANTAHFRGYPYVPPPASAY